MNLAADLDEFFARHRRHGGLTPTVGELTPNGCQALLHCASDGEGHHELLHAPPSCLNETSDDWLSTANALEHPTAIAVPTRRPAVRAFLPNLSGRHQIPCASAQKAVRVCNYWRRSSQPIQCTQRLPITFDGSRGERSIAVRLARTREGEFRQDQGTFPRRRNPRRRSRESSGRPCVRRRAEGNEIDLSRAARTPPRAQCRHVHPWVARPVGSSCTSLAAR